MGQIINLINNSYVREHPFTDPITQTTPGGIAAPAQNHSYIFPGDELFLYNFFTFPSDHPTAGSINDIHFISAKVSLISKHPEVFSEEFSEQFLSSRIFTLDSFITQFNNVNAPLIPWTSDGYAPFLNIEQDRNFKLPSGDLRREVKMFTTHTPSSNQWKFWFYYPILFRWEYWLAKTGVNNFFFDVNEPQNGHNEWWYRYYQTVGGGDWRIYSRLEVTAMVMGVETVFKSDRLLTPDAAVGGDVNDYNSNADWINKSVKTAVIMGTPSNTPCLIKSNEDTEVFGYFDKVAPWDPSEQTNISAVIWMEPFEGAGVTQRTRASSLYPVGSESAFYGLGTSITDDSGIGITDDSGDYIVIDDNGNGVIVYFDALNPEKVVVFGLIDHEKLATIYPGVTKFTLYVRLYNSYVDVDKTRKGECIKQDALLITMPVTNDLCDRREPMCPFNLDVFAQKGGSDDLKNDKSDFYEYADARITDIQFTLQKQVGYCNDQWEDKVTISNQLYGNYFAFGNDPNLSGDAFEDDYGKKYTGLLLKWQKVIDAWDIGNYRMKITKTDIFSNTEVSYDPRTFCLREYNCNLINRTVRIETLNQGLRGTLNDPTVLIDYGSGWNGQVRLKGVMKYKGSGYTTETNQYGDTNHNMIRPIINEQKPKYILSIRPVPGWMHFRLSTEVLQADQILITDYNTANLHDFVRVPVMNDGEFTPLDTNLMNVLSPVDISLAYGQNNLRKRNSQ
jgi:hypothetical protein